MKDWRRMNVSFTRAKSKLIMFGSKKTLQSVPLLKEFFNLMEARDWILHLPPNAHQLHETVERRLSSKKRPAEDSPIDLFAMDLKANTLTWKKGKKDISQGVLKGRPILKDLINDTKWPYWVGYTDTL